MTHPATSSGLVLKIAKLNTVTVPVTCEQYGDNNKVVDTLKLQVTFIKTGKDDWKRESEAADASEEDTGINILLREKIQDIKGLPLEQDGQPVPFNADAMDLVLQQQWIVDELWAALLAINSGKRSDAYRRQLLKN